MCDPYAREHAVVMKDLTEFISNKPLRDQGALSCPWCSSPDVQVRESMTTLLAGPPEINHVTKFCKCNACTKAFNVETKSGYRWVTTGQFVLTGLPCCFEDYTLTHKDCGGLVRRDYRSLAGSPLKGGLRTKFENGKAVREYRVFWCCATCKAQIETEADYWYPPTVTRDTNDPNLKGANNVDTNPRNDQNTLTP